MTIRVMTYNILNGAHGREALLLEILQTVQPDIVVFQEVTGERMIRDFADTLDMDHFFAPGNNTRSLALMSRLPITSRRNYSPFPPVSRAIVEVSVEYAPDQELQVFGIHPIAFFMLLFEWWRLVEMNVVLSRADLYRSKPCLIAGDFNAISVQDAVDFEIMPWFMKSLVQLHGKDGLRQCMKRVLQSDFVDCYRTLHPDQAGFTKPAPRPYVRLDYIFANKVLRPHLSRCEVIREPAAVDKASDHYPVVAEFDIA